MPRNRPLLICYVPGARGDFLAAILLNRPAAVLASQRVDSAVYTKLHLTLTEEIPDLSSYYSVRVKLDTVWDRLTCLYRWRELGLSWQPPLEIGMSAVERAEILADQTEFDLTIPFSALGNINCVTAIYQDHYPGIQPNAAWLEAVGLGINLQPRITGETYQEYYPQWPNLFK